MKIDYHLHTKHSIDGHGDVRDYCLSAIKKGFGEICITNHQEWTSVADGQYSFALTDQQWEYVIRDVESARIEFPNLRIKFGVELGWYPKYKKEILAFSKKYPFDFILGCVHRVSGIWVPQITSPLRTDEIEFYKKYYERLQEMVSQGFCNCVGHLDIVTKSSKILPFEGYRNSVIDCIEEMKKQNIGFELNSRGWAYPNAQAYPSPEILKLLNEAGIRQVTIGSDSHKPDGLGFEYEKSVQLLKKAGFVKICTYDRQKPTFHSIG